MSCSTNTCDPNTTITASDLAALKTDIDTIDTVVESPALTTVTKSGREIDTLNGRLTKLGWTLPPVTYAGSIAFAIEDNVQTIDRSGIIYAPLPSELPFTTSGTWTADDEDKFFVVQSVMLYDGDVVLTKPTVADMQADASLQLGNVIRTEGYQVSGDQGAATYRVYAAGTAPIDGGTGISLTASGHMAIVIGDSAQINVAQFGAYGNGVADDTAPVQAAIDAMSTAGGGDLIFPLTGGGVYKCNLTLRPGVNLVGVSRDVKLIPCLNAPVVALQADADVARVTIRDLTIDGSATSGTYTAQDGVRCAPDAGYVHSNISIVDCLITDCGAAGVVLYGVEPDGSVEHVVLPQLLRTVVTDCAGPGLSVYGNVTLLEAINCDFRENGDETTDNLSNIVFERSPLAIPIQNALTSCRVETDSYVAGGYALAVLGAVDLAVNRCQFSEFHTAVLIDNPPNGGISINDSRFDRTTGDITAVVEIVDVSRFIYNGNNVGSATTGPVGLDMGLVAANVRRLEIGSANSWGGLDSSTTQLPIKFITTAATSITMQNTFGPIPISLDADGTASVDTLYDFNGGTEQLVHGDTITINIKDVARTLTLVHVGGNIRLNGGVNFLLDELQDRIVLQWDENLDAWVELSRSSGT